MDQFPNPTTNAPSQIEVPPSDDIPFWEKLPSIKKILDVSSWVLLFSLAPFTILILLSQNTNPGDPFYPVKRGMENVILAAAAVNPVTRVAFRTDLTERRFNEAETLLLAKQDVEGLRQFVSAVTVAHEELIAIDNTVEKEQLQQTFNTSLDKYKERLGTIETKLGAQGQNLPIALASGNKPIPTLTPTAAPTMRPSPLPTNTPVPRPTSQPGQPHQPTNTPVPLSPTATPRPTSIPATPTPIPPPAQPPTAPAYTREPHKHPLHYLGLNTSAYIDCLIIPNITAGECFHHLEVRLRPGSSASSASPTSTPTPEATPTGIQPGNNWPQFDMRTFSADTPTPDPLIPTETPVPTNTPVPTQPIATPTPVCFIYGWNAQTCSMPAGAPGTDFGRPEYCGWDQDAWDSCNKRYPKVQGALDVKIQKSLLEEIAEWFGNLLSP